MCIAHGFIEFLAHVGTKLVFEAGVRHVANLRIEPRHFLHLGSVIAEIEGVQLLNR